MRPLHTAVTDRSPFYAEAGGQIGDRGEIETPTGRATVLDCRSVEGVHVMQARVEEGSLETGQTATLRVDAARRDAIRRNHTATHLLHQPQGGKGILLGGIPAARRGKVVIMGGGHSEYNMAVYERVAQRDASIRQLNLRLRETSKEA